MSKRGQSDAVKVHVGWNFQDGLRVMQSKYMWDGMSKMGSQ